MAFPPMTKNQYSLFLKKKKIGAKHEYLQHLVPILPAEVLLTVSLD